MKNSGVLGLIFAVILSGTSFCYSQSSADYKKACYFINKGRFQQAVNMLAPLAENDSYILNDHAAFRLAAAFDVSGNKQQAEIEYTNLTNKFPESVFVGKAYYRLGELYAGKGDFLNAIANFEKSLSFNVPVFSRDVVIFRAAQCLEKLGYLDEAAERYSEIVVNYPKSRTTKVSKKKINQMGAVSILSSVQQIYKQTRSLFAVDISPDDSANEVWREGFILYKSGDFESAFIKLGQYPGDADPRIVSKCVFWRAKSAEKAGLVGEQHKLLEYITVNYPYTYYGMRACQILNYQVQSVPESGVSLPKLSELAIANIHFEKFKELLSIKYFEDAASEAKTMVYSSSSERDIKTGKLCLSLLLNLQKNYYHSIKTLEKAGEYDFYSTDLDSEKYLAMNLAYPTAFKSQVFAVAEKYGVDPYLVFALIREESRFNPRAVSRSSARGLAQIMPRTGRGIATRLYLRPYRTKYLFNPNLNIKMGVYYLSQLLKRFGGDKYLALASYNGGAGNVDKWLNRIDHSDIDEFVESIPLAETKLYVKKVLESYWQYIRIYGQS
ncbi:MAG: transglycosylase SLT domain-containing protein [Candidatus Saganbacteria bacterium]|nr:transglycosylase SLT domain-containing protein [Candidatus Saganbacteria bacterium]